VAEHQELQVLGGLAAGDQHEQLEGAAHDEVRQAAVLYPEDARYLLGESTVTHYQVVDQVKDPSGPGEKL
jgi:hypothetical protein